MNDRNLMVQFKDILLLDNGARFHNVDLHIHSYGASHDVKDSYMTPEAIVDSAVRQGISIIAITDHNSNINVQKAIDHAQENYNGLILVLPGVEVSTAHGHLLVYFAPERTANLTKFLFRLELVGEMGADNTRTAKSMVDTIAEAEKLDGICIAAHIDREKTGFDMFAPGFQNWKKDIITSSGLYGLECDTENSLMWYSEHDESGSAGVERKRMFEARRLVVGLSARHHFAHVQGSDAHSMQRFEHQDPSKPWTRIKLAELSFNALRVALIDPTARVRACVSIPQAIPRIRGIAITGGFLHQEMIHFSDNLNCLIGGRGTGKSTAIRAIAYAFGLNNEFGKYDNCPDSVTVFCEDASGIVYRYVRTRGGEIEVKAREDSSISEVPIDAFRIEYFGQGELTKVAEDPLKNPNMFQGFLDRHTNLRDLVESEKSIVTNLRENASRLIPLERAFTQMAEKKSLLKDIGTKLKLAEEGNLREVVGMQSKLASEKTVRESIEVIAAQYTKGYPLSGIQRSFDQILSTAGTCTGDDNSNKALLAIKATLLKNNNAVKQIELNLNLQLKTCANELNALARELKESHQRMCGQVAIKLADLKARGIATNIPGLEALLSQKISVSKEIADIEQQTNEREDCWEHRSKLLKELIEVRDKMTARRKAQLKGINSNLAEIIKDYTIFVKYDDAGITSDFESFIQEKMQGTYIQGNLIESFCRNITPSDLADFILDRNHNQIATKGGISTEWAHKIFDKLYYWGIIFELQALAKQPKPIIIVLTKSIPHREIPVLQLSDGQRHTILLTIAMLAESNVPLVIDQPEDDLDNAFIFSSIVTTLRAIKEKRQVILVTHNANIAVLGDSEQLLPMCRDNDCGKIKDRGSIDAHTTQRSVINILEGGSAAFLRRKEIYSH
jgi:DNA repair ATPase RecN